MRRETPFTVEAAKLYLQETIEVWEDTQPYKIIALAGSAYNQRNKKATISNAARLKAIGTILNATNLNIDRKQNLDKDANVDRLYEERDELQKEIERLKAELAKEPPETPKTLKQPKKRKLLERALLQKKQKKPSYRS